MNKLYIACISIFLETLAQGQPSLEMIDNTPEFACLRVTGTPGRGYRIDTSSDLAFWTFLVSSNATSGLFTYSDPKALSATRRFYRAAESSELIGQLRNLGRGTVRSWVRLGTDGRPNAIGVAITESALTNLPSSDLELVLSLPSDPAVAPFNHIGLNWNPHGHPPSGIYNKPHFDFHFYLISVQERNAINSTDGGVKMYRAPDPAFLPPDYALSPGSGDAGMGSHWFDVTSPEFNGESFTHTLIYGYYDAKLTFIEPMVTLAFLQSRTAVEPDIKQPASFDKTGTYPLRYKISYSPGFREYSISLEGLTPRTASLSRPQRVDVLR